MNIHHHLLDPQDTIRIKDVNNIELLDDEQKIAVKKALSDIGFLMSTTYREQVFRLCSLLHGPAKNGSPIVSCDSIGALFTQPRTHGAIIDEFRKSLFEPNAPHRPFILLDDEIEKIKEELERTKDDFPTIDDISFFLSVHRDQQLKEPLKKELKDSKSLKLKE